MRQHPEGGWYVETWRAPAGPNEERPAASTILYLLAAADASHWHRVDASEVWQWSGGDPLDLRIWSPSDAAVTTVRLGGDVLAGERPQAVVPKGGWQAATPLGDWTLVGCIVAPAFSFDGFELAPPGWEPPVSGS